MNGHMSSHVVVYRNIIEYETIRIDDIPSSNLLKLLFFYSEKIRGFSRLGHPLIFKITPCFQIIKIINILSPFFELFRRRSQPGVN